MSCDSHSVTAELLLKASFTKHFDFFVVEFLFVFLGQTHVVRARLPLPGLTLPEDSASVRKLL